MARRHINTILTSYLSRNGGFMDGSIKFTVNDFYIARNPEDSWKEGNLTHPWYGLQYPSTNTLAGAFLSSYYGLTFRTSYGKAKIDERGNLLISGKITENWGGGVNPSHSINYLEKGGMLHNGKEERKRGSNSILSRLVRFMVIDEWGNFKIYIPLYGLTDLNECYCKYSSRLKYSNNSRNLRSSRRRWRKYKLSSRMPKLTFGSFPQRGKFLYTKINKFRWDNKNKDNFELRGFLDKLENNFFNLISEKEVVAA